MKQLLNGVAIAAVFALAVPAFAQTTTPMTPAKPAASAPAPKAAAPAPAPKAAATAPKTTATKPMMHHVAHHMMSKDDQMTEQLNQQELARITGGSMPAAPAPMPAAPPPPAK